MTSRPRSPTFPPPKKYNALRGSPISKPPYVTCHIVCQPLSPPPHRKPHHTGHPCQYPLPPPPSKQGKDRA